MAKFILQGMVIKKSKVNFHNGDTPYLTIVVEERKLKKDTLYTKEFEILYYNNFVKCVPDNVGLIGAKVVVQGYLSSKKIDGKYKYILMGEKFVIASMPSFEYKEPEKIEKTNVEKAFEEE